VKNAFQVQRRLLQKLKRLHPQNSPCAVKDRRKKHRNQKGKHDHQAAQDGVFANRQIRKTAFVLLFISTPIPLPMLH